MTEPVAPEPVAAGGRFALPADPRQRAIAIGGAAVALLLLVFVATRILFGGGGGDEAAAPAPVVPPPTTAPPVTAVPPTETFEVFNTKNPFTPLVGAPGSLTPTPPGGGGSTPPVVIVPPPSGGGSTPTTLGGGRTTPTTAPVGGGGSSGGSGGTGGGSGGSGAPSRSTGDNEPRRQQRVALLDVFTQGGRLRANVRVNDTVHNVAEGDVFAGSYRVVSLSASPECGRFVFGDDAFRLCRGEETLK